MRIGNRNKSHSSSAFMSGNARLSPYSQTTTRAPFPRTKAVISVQDVVVWSIVLKYTTQIILNTYTHNQTANFLKSSSAKVLSALSFVLSKCTFGTNPSRSLEPSGKDLAWSTASFHRATHKHHLHPSFNPIWVKSLPRLAENLRNEDVTVAEGRIVSLDDC